MILGGGRRNTNKNPKNKTWIENCSLIVRRCVSHHAGPACLPLPAAVDVQTERAQSSEFPAPSASSVWFMGNQSVWGLRPLVFRSGSVRLTANWEGKFLLVVQRTGRFSFPLSRVYMRKFIVVLRFKAVLSHNYPSSLSS